ncbi:MAG: magnesium/cobalt transporter CorA [Planctomycetes bacterium]|nr:magnesium/cobalt transporter CorA [Planctomycetota bacterium]
MRRRSPSSSRANRGRPHRPDAARIRATDPDRRRCGMSRRRRRAPAGAPPGHLAIDPTAPSPRVRVIRYDADAVEEAEVARPGDIEPIRAKGGVLWVDVQGLGDESILREIGTIFAIHELALADAVNIPQRPKAEAYESHAFLVTRMVREGEAKELIAEQVSIAVGDRFVLSLQQRYGDCLDPVRDRIRTGKGRIRKLDADYLAYAILDAVLDGYFPVLEDLGERLEALEDRIIEKPSRETLAEIFELRRRLLELRRAIWPQRDAVNVLIRDEIPWIGKKTRPFFRDTYDHVVQILDVVEGHREIAASFIDVYLSSVSNRMNEVMKVLTIIATIFIPLTFIAGVYGMNFEHMPEIGWRLGYPLCWLAMLGVTAALVIFFRRKGWLRKEE